MGVEMEKDKKIADHSKLRRCAEKKLEATAGGIQEISEMSPEKMASLIHELRVHQIELEMQNDELLRVQDQLETTRDRYSHLYDFAPVGYLTMSEKGIIKEVNLTGAVLMGIERSALIGKPFTRFVLRDDQDIFYKHRHCLLETGTALPCELRLVKKDGHVFYAHLEFLFIKHKRADLSQIRAVVSDITERKKLEKEREKLIHELQSALLQVKVLKGLLPICAHCKNIRNDDGYWSKIESYIHQHSDAEFSHSICPECAKKYFPDMDIYDDNGEVTED
jgi:PAS domain S-box-containing protein